MMYPQQARMSRTDSPPPQYQQDIDVKIPAVAATGLEKPVTGGQSQQVPPMKGPTGLQ
jgi:hypothetical protein